MGIKDIVCVVYDGLLPAAGLVTDLQLVSFEGSKRKVDAG